jgi:hypothetical protein
MRRPQAMLALAALGLGLGAGLEAEAAEQVIEISFANTYYRVGRLTLGPEAIRRGGGAEAESGGCAEREGAGEPARGGGGS